MQTPFTGKPTAGNNKLRAVLHAKVRAWTLTEAVVALWLLGIGLSGILVANSRVLTQLRSIRQTGTATQALQERVDLIRRANWTELTNSSYLSGTVLGTAPLAGNGLPGLVEEIDIGAYPPSGNRIRLQRAANGSVSILSVNPTLGTSAKTVSVFVRLTWKGDKGVTRRRECATIIAKGGITR